ncbi:hypothetical protein [Gellertiella hungarica]|uniref:DUF4189 domain-containing protein n=1 Tax=Gellertiella hungarica TaxID=1572859 RepID=A0A7W6NMR9_9HYPH|nr:hypothetical protein [Gellertiella hungarica]MBB4066730.1 hypothetical protein [Gellertiella hungarica]
MRKIVTTLAMMAAFMASPALAERKGIAFVEAPEMSSGMCTGANREEAFGCARKQCIDNGGTDADCIDTTYCFPAFWSVDVFKQNNDGFHWHEIHCGAGSKEDALAIAKAVCDKVRNPELMECAAARLFDEDGKEYEVPAE